MSKYQSKLPENTMRDNEFEAWCRHERRFYLVVAIVWAVAAHIALTVAASAAPPELMTVAYPIEGNRSAMGKATAIGPNLVLSADHVIRDMESSLGPVVAVDRKYDRCLIERRNETWSEIRRTPVSRTENLFFEGGTCRLHPDGGMQIITGRAVSGMSGGAIWDNQGRIVSVVCEGEPDNGRLWGYLGLAEWVDQHSAAQQPSVEPEATVDDLKARIALLVNGSPESIVDPPRARPTLRERISQYERGGGQAWYVGGGQTSIAHMVREHGWSHSELRGLTARELNLLHGASHVGVMSAGDIDPPPPSGPITGPTNTAQHSISDTLGASRPRGRELAIITADWCYACRSIPHDVPGTRVLDLYRDQVEIVRLYGKMPSRLPAFVTVVDGEGIKNWYGKTTRGGVVIMRDWEP